MNSSQTARGLRRRTGWWRRARYRLRRILRLGQRAATGGAAAVLLLTSPAHSDDGNRFAEGNTAQHGVHADVAVPQSTLVSLRRALRARLTLRRAGNRPVYVSHCRRSPIPCEERVDAIAEVLTQAGMAHGVDPFLLGGIAVVESGLNPFAEGSHGERGIVQLHPRGVGANVPFVRSEAYRQRCARTASACQEEIARVGADLVARAIENCGSVALGLGAYNSGTCQEGLYSRRVLSERQNLLILAKAATH